VASGSAVDSCGKDCRIAAQNEAAAGAGDAGVDQFPAQHPVFSLWEQQ